MAGASGRSPSRFLLGSVLLVVGLFGARAGAQAASPCSDSVATAGSYVTCALWFDGPKLKEGTPGRVVAKPGFFKPTALTRVVVGDSALFHARAYEQNWKTSQAFSLVGLAMIGGAFLLASNYECDPQPTFGLCTRGDDSVVIGATALMLGGTVMTLVSIPFTIRANRSASKAVWWNNARYGR